LTEGLKCYRTKYELGTEMSQCHRLLKKELFYSSSRGQISTTELEISHTVGWQRLGHTNIASIGFTKMYILLDKLPTGCISNNWGYFQGTFLAQ